MKNNSNSGGVEVLTAILSALHGLDPDAQKRTLQTVATFLDLQLFTPSQVQMLPSYEAPTFSQENNRAPKFSENRTLSAKDFIRDKSPKTDVERVACLAYYLTHYKDTPHFKTLDISTLNTEAAQPKFANAAKSVANAARAGLIVQAIKGAKQLSAAGESFVQSLPTREAAKQSLSGIKSRRKNKKTSKA